MSKNPFTKKQTAAEQAPATQEKTNLFKNIRRSAPLHSTQPVEPKPKAKSFSFYAEDLNRLEELRHTLSPRSSKRVSDSVVVRVALVYLEEQLREKDGNTNFEKQLRNLLLIQS